MAGSHSKQVSMTDKLLSRVDAVKTALHRNRSQLIGASIFLLMVSTPKEIEAAIKDAPMAAQSDSVRVTFSIKKDTWKRLSDTARALGREKALLVRVAVESFLKLPRAEQDRAIIAYVK